MVSLTLTFSAFLVLACAVGTSASPSGSVVNVVDLGYAKYQGSVNPTTKNIEFLGMRYAAPPTGKLFSNLRYG
jgi:cholinesterase